MIDKLTGVSLEPSVLQECFLAEFISELRQYNKSDVKPIKESVTVVAVTEAMQVTFQESYGRQSCETSMHA